MIEQLGYLVIDATDVAAWQRFATRFVGLEAVERADGVLLLKADARDYRLMIRPAEVDRLYASGWEVANRAAFVAIGERLRAANVAVAQASAQEAAERSVTGLLSFTDPAGNRGEVYWGPISEFRRMVSPVGVSRFVTGALGLGHVVLPAAGTFEATQRFWTEVMGFGLSDILHSRRNPEKPAPIHFLHCNPRQHSLALADIPNPTGCIHMMLELPDIDELGLALDRVHETGVPLWASLGRHVNDGMISFYVMTPGGFGLEVGCGGLVKDWDADGTVFETTRGSHWGHRFQTLPEK